MPPAEYRPRDPSAPVLYAVVRDHFETFRAESARLRDGDGLPRFVEDAPYTALLSGTSAPGLVTRVCVEGVTAASPSFSGSAGR